jgi:hypothetical protein
MHWNHHRHKKQRTTPNTTPTYETGPEPVQKRAQGFEGIKAAGHASRTSYAGHSTSAVRGNMSNSPPHFGRRIGSLSLNSIRASQAQTRACTRSQFIQQHVPGAEDLDGNESDTENNQRDGELQFSRDRGRKDVGMSSRGAPRHRLDGDMSKEEEEGVERDREVPGSSSWRREAVEYLDELEISMDGAGLPATQASLGLR